MKFLPLIAIFLSAASYAQNKYYYTADLQDVKNDKVSIELQTPRLNEAEAIFSFAKAIPGSYSQKDFGRFIDDFCAFDNKGDRMKVEKLNTNQYRIRNVAELTRITYKVSDTWDEERKNFVFQPGGSNIEEGKNFVLNNHAFFGYFEGMCNLPIEVRVNKPASLYAATHLTVNRKSPVRDILYAKNFFSLSDNPIIYAEADTTSFKVGNTRINVAVYSASGKINSRQIAGYLKPMSIALNKFFNGLPVSSYQFLYYFEAPHKALVNQEKGQGGYGALEHNYSSLYYLPEIGYEEQLKALVTEVSSHEFLHIQTPLNLHSEEIENFNFSSPKMSAHLWLYEGVTEYFANLVQFQNGLISEKEFFSKMRDKINEAEEFGNFSMTEMSQRVMEPDYQKKYNSVYNRGALIAFMLDVFIRERTSNKKDLKSVVAALAKKYGPAKPFKDNNFFNELIAASHPDVKDFINRYIAGSEPLPYSDFFDKVGYEYQPDKKQQAFYAGDMGLKYDDSVNKFVFANVKENPLEIQENDVFEKVDDIAVTRANLEDVWQDYFNLNTDHPQIAITVKRNGEEVVLSGKLNRSYFKIKNYLAPKLSSSETRAERVKLISRESR